MRFDGQPSLRGYLQRLRNELKRPHPMAALCGQYARKAATEAFRLYPSVREHGAGLKLKPNLSRELGKEND